MLTNNYEDLKNSPKVVDDIFNTIDVAMIHRSLKTFSYKQGHKSKVDQKDYETSFVHYYNNEEVKKMSFYIKINAYLRDNLNYKLGLEKCYVHSYGMDQKTMTHADNSTPTVMLYCNPNWQSNWGGETIIYDTNNEIKKAASIEVAFFISNSQVMTALFYHLITTFNEVCKLFTF